MARCILKTLAITIMNLYVDDCLTGLAGSWGEMVNAIPLRLSANVFIMVKVKLVIIFQSQARSVLAGLLMAKGLNTKEFGVHMLRRSRASLALSQNIPAQYIKAHNTSTSDSVYNYIDPVCYQTVSNHRHFS